MPDAVSVNESKAGTSEGLLAFQSVLVVTARHCFVWRMVDGTILANCIRVGGLAVCVRAVRVANGWARKLRQAPCEATKLDVRRNE